MHKHFLEYGFLPMVFDEDQGDAGGGAGGGSGGDEGGDAGDQNLGGNDGGDDQGGAGASDGDQGDAGDEDGSGEDQGDEGDQKGGKPSGDDKPGERKGVWSDNWREEYAGEDDKTLTYLKRFNSPKELMDKVFEQDKLIRSGGHKKEGLGENPSDEDVAKYREENGIPADPDGYLDHLPEGLVIGEDMKEGFQPYLEKMHGLNAPPEMVAAGLEVYQAEQEQMAELVSARDKELSDAATLELKEKWGADYGANIQAMENFIQGQVPDEFKEAFMAARLGDDGGTPLFASSAMVEMISSLQRQLNPMGTTTSGSGMDNLDAIEDQIASYEKQMGTKAWYNDEKSQSHYRELVSARDRYKK